MNGNSKRPNGVVMAVFGMSSATGIWLNAPTRSTVKNTVAPCKAYAKTWMCGTGYWSGHVRALRAR